MVKKQIQLTVDQKYKLYEAAVQSPDHDIPWVIAAYRNIFSKEPQKLREDFCGTFKLSCYWVGQDKKKSAICLDLSDEPLDYGKRKNLVKLTPHEKKRIQLKKQNVITVTSPKSDVIMAYNFSFFIFKQRQELLRYFNCCYDSLDKQGMVVFEIAGGPGMIQKIKETKTVSLGKNKKSKFKYIWDQKTFNPITHEATYSIHFKFPNGKTAKDVFCYDWRVWTLPEMMDVLEEAGFKETTVYWENMNQKAKSIEYLPTKIAENDWSWVSYLIAIKRD